jgi:hypothetical protein
MTFYGPPAAVLGRAGKARSEPRVPTWDPDAKEPFSRQVFQRTEVGAHRRANPPQVEPPLSRSSPGGALPPL